MANHLGSSEQRSLTLHHLKTIAMSLERVVANFYGPQCSQTLMTSSTGKAVVTSDGYTILQSINASHPLSSMIKKAIDACHQYTYDGCKTFIIYLARFLSLAEIEVMRGTFLPDGAHGKGNRQANECQSVLSISHCLRKIIDETMPNVYAEAIYYCCRNYKQMRSLNETLKCVANTTLMPHFNPKLCHFLTEIIGDSISDTKETESIRKSLDVMLRYYDSICIRIPDQPYDRSQTVASYIIQREFTLVCDAVKNRNTLNVVLMKTTLYRTNGAEEPHKTLKIKGSLQIKDSLIGKVKTVTTFADQCLKLDIHAILTSEGVPQFALDILRARGISVVHYVLKEDITVLESLAGTLAVADIDDLSESNVIQAKQVCPISICGRKCVHIQLESKIKVKNLILCAPTVGMCDQLYLSIQKAIKAMYLCLIEDPQDSIVNSEIDVNQTSDKDKLHSASSVDSGSRNSSKSENDSIKSNCDLLAVPGGGGFELLVSNILKKHTKNVRNTNVRRLCYIISDILIEVVRILHTNTAESCKDKHDGVRIVEYLQRQFSEGLLLGFNRRGKPTELYKTGVAEPLVSKIHTLNCVLSLLEQLLRIDQIVSVKSQKAQD